MNKERWKDESAERYSRGMSKTEIGIIATLVVILLVALISFLAKGGGAVLPWMS